jgi:ABC-type transport system substrate-binding protein
MKRSTRFLLSSLAAGLLFAPAVTAATTSADEMQERYEKKLKLKFIEYGGWITDFDQARSTAKEQGKVLFVYFSRSYAP